MVRRCLILLAILLAWSAAPLGGQSTPRRARSAVAALAWPRLGPHWVTVAADDRRRVALDLRSVARRGHRSTLWLRIDLDPKATPRFAPDGTHHVVERLELECPSRHVRTRAVAYFTATGGALGVAHDVWPSFTPIEPRSLAAVLFPLACRRDQG